MGLWLLLPFGGIVVNSLVSFSPSLAAQIYTLLVFCNINKNIATNPTQILYPRLYILVD